MEFDHVDFTLTSKAPPPFFSIYNNETMPKMAKPLTVHDGLVIAMFIANDDHDLWSSLVYTFAPTNAFSRFAFYGDLFYNILLKRSEKICRQISFSQFHAGKILKKNKNFSITDAILSLSQRLANFHSTDF